MMGKITGKGGPELEQGTPIQEVNLPLMKCLPLNRPIEQMVNGLYNRYSSKIQKRRKRRRR